MIKLSRIITFLTILAFSAIPIAAQVSFPAASQMESISQHLGDGKINIVYHRPNVKGRNVFGTKDSKALVPYGEVWRAGANDNTTIEITQDSMINGMKLPKGKYGFHIIPMADSWTLIFNKVNNAWGSFSYKEDQDALRVKVKPVANEMTETLTFSIGDLTVSTANVSLSWDRLKVVFKVDLGDVNGRLLDRVESISTNAPIRAAQYVARNKISNQYDRAIGWLDNVMSSTDPADPAYSRVKFNVGLTKAQILAESGKTAEAKTLAKETLEYAKKINEDATKNGKRPAFGNRQITMLTVILK